MSLPSWSSHSSFGTPRTRDIGSIGLLLLSGSYLFFSETDPDHVETLTMDFLVSPS